MVEVRQMHLDRSGRNCPGTSHALGTWPLPVEIRTSGRGYELVINGGRPRAWSGPVSAIAALIELGVEYDEARRLVATLTPGKPSLVEVLERRKVPRATN
jgi:hypothetical protein